MSKTMVGTRVPQEWADKLSELAQIEGKTQSQVIYQAIAAYLGESVSKNNSVIDQVNELRQRLEELTKKLTA